MGVGACLYMYVDVVVKKVKDRYLIS